jgi:hypothetical protein
MDRSNHGVKLRFIVSLACRKFEFAGQFLVEFSSVEFSLSLKILEAVVNYW